MGGHPRRRPITRRHQGRQCARRDQRCRSRGGIVVLAGQSRFESPRKLVGYLGLDPRVCQSGSSPATHGRISKQGSVSARHALVEASWSTVRQPGPLHAFYQRIRARRGHSVAIVACARKLACLFWCLLSREEDYAYQAALADRQEAAAARGTRRLAVAQGRPHGDVRDPRADAGGRARARGAGRVRLRADGRRVAADAREEEGGRRRDTGARIFWPVKRASSAAGRSPKSCALARRRRHPPASLTPTEPILRPPTMVGGGSAWPKPAPAHR